MDREDGLKRVYSQLHVLAHLPPEVVYEDDV